MTAVPQDMLDIALGRAVRFQLVRRHDASPPAVTRGLLALGEVNATLAERGMRGRDAVVYLAAYHALKGSNDESASRRAEAYKDRYTELRAALQVGRDKPEVVALERKQETRAPNPAQLFSMYS